MIAADRRHLSKDTKHETQRRVPEGTVGNGGRHLPSDRRRNVIYEAKIALRFWFVARQQRCRWDPLILQLIRWPSQSPCTLL